MIFNVKPFSGLIAVKQCAIFLLLVLFASLSVAKEAASGTASLRAFYAQTQAMKANFHQVVTDAQGAKIQEVHGVMQIKRPNQFRWDYQKPYEQQIVSDGKQVWLYDVDLEQVTVSGVTKALGSSPAALLSGNENIDTNFVMRDFNREDGLAWVSVVPKSNETGFTKIELGFNQAQLLQKMLLVDSFGQHTNITFSMQEKNPEIDAKSFFFQPPEGVDVVGE